MSKKVKTYVSGSTCFTHGDAIEMAVCSNAMIFTFQLLKIDSQEHADKASQWMRSCHWHSIERPFVYRFIRADGNMTRWFPTI